MNKLTAEFLGTFIFCAVALMSRSSLATAGALAAMVYSLAYISGGHLNPAVSIAVWLRGQMDRNEMWRYIAAQLLGAVSALVLAWILSGPGEVVVRGEFPWFRALIGETMFTFVLAFTFLHVRTARQVLGNTWFGIAVALTYFAGATTLATISGGKCNPALGLAYVLQGGANGSMIPVYLLSGILGGSAAAVAYRLLNPND